jgi:hypothetical protein
MRSIVSVEIVLPMCASPKMCCLKWLDPFSIWMRLSFKHKMMALCPLNKGITIGFLELILAKENQCFQSLLMKTCKNTIQGYCSWNGVDPLGAWELCPYLINTFPYTSQWFENLKKYVYLGL